MARLFVHEKDPAELVSLHQPLKHKDLIRFDVSRRSTIRVTYRSTHHQGEKLKQSRLVVVCFLISYLFREEFKELLTMLRFSLLS